MSQRMLTKYLQRQPLGYVLDHGAVSPTTNTKPKIGVKDDQRGAMFRVDLHQRVTEFDLIHLFARNLAVFGSGCWEL
jgi:hypothetical protein